MFQKQTIKKNLDFQKIIQQKLVFRSKSFFIYSRSRSCQDPQAPTLFFGVSVGKKLGNAVYRNHTKRQIRAMIRNFKPVLDLKLDYDFVIIVSKHYDRFSFAKNETALHQLFKKIIESK